MNIIIKEGIAQAKNRFPNQELKILTPPITNFNYKNNLKVFLWYNTQDNSTHTLEISHLLKKYPSKVKELHLD